MKSHNRHFLTLLLIVGGFAFANAQQKTLAVGTATLNPNAALHVESPTNNQGAILPRLTTAQRTAMAGILGVADAGLILYDNDLKALFIWDGNSWESSAKLNFPFKDSVVTATGTTDLFALKYNNAEPKRVMRIESLNPANGSSAVSIGNNSNGLGIYVQNTNINTISSSIMATNASDNLAANPSPVGVYGEATGLAASGGSFRNINVNNSRAALYAETLGTGPTAYFLANNATNSSSVLNSTHAGAGRAAQFETNSVTNTNPALFVTTNSDAGGGFNAPAAVYGSSTGTGSLAASFRVTNAANSYPALYAETIGTGYAFMAKQSNTSTGHAGYFEVSNVGNVASAIYGKTLGTGTAINGLTTGTGVGGRFEIINAANTQAALEAVTDGVGPAISLNQNNGGLAIDVVTGGLKHSVLTIGSLPATLTEKVGVVHVTASSGILTFTNTGRVNGETIIVVASSPFSVNGLGSGEILQVNLSSNEVKTFIFVNGYWVAQGMYAP